MSSTTLDTTKFKPIKLDADSPAFADIPIEMRPEVLDFYKKFDVHRSFKDESGIAVPLKPGFGSCSTIGDGYLDANEMAQSLGLHLTAVPTEFKSRSVAVDNLLFDGVDYSAVSFDSKDGDALVNQFIINRDTLGFIPNFQTGRFFVPDRYQDEQSTDDQLELRMRFVERSFWEIVDDGEPLQLEVTQADVEDVTDRFLESGFLINEQILEDGVLAEAILARIDSDCLYEKAGEVSYENFDSVRKKMSRTTEDLEMEFEESDSALTFDFNDGEVPPVGFFLALRMLDRLISASKVEDLMEMEMLAEESGCILSE